MNFFKVGHAPVLALGDRRNGHQPAQHDVGEALGPFGGGADLGDGKAALGLLPADVDLKENGLDDAELFGLPFTMDIAGCLFPYLCGRSPTV